MPAPYTALSLDELAKLVPLTVRSPARVSTLGFLPDQLPGMLTFLEDRRHLHSLASNDAVAATITTPDLASLVPEHLGVLLSEEPRRSFFELQNALVERTAFYGEKSRTEIHPAAQVHPRAEVAAHNVSIGPGVKIQSGAVIEEGVALAEGAVVQPGAVLGATGFQTYREDDVPIEIAHAGRLEVGRGAIIFANAVLARGVFRQATRIGSHCRIGVNAFISHNVEIGDVSFVGHGAVVNGNCRIGRKAWIGPGAVLSNGIEVQERAEISLGAVVIGGVTAGSRVSGNFAISHQRLLRHLAELEQSS